MQHILFLCLVLRYSLYIWLSVSCVWRGEDFFVFILFEIHSLLGYISWSFSSDWDILAINSSKHFYCIIYLFPLGLQNACISDYLILILHFTDILSCFKNLFFSLLQFVNFHLLFFKFIDSFFCIIQSKPIYWLFFLSHTLFFHF